MKRLILVLLALSISACAAPQYTGPEIDQTAKDQEAVVQKTYAFRRILADQQRLQNVGYPIARDGIELCGKQVGPKYGFLAQDISSLEDDYKSIARTELNASTGLAVMAVANSSPAHQAGLQVGDVFRTVNSKPIKTGADLTAILLSFADMPTDIEIMIERDGLTQSLTISPEMACVFDVAYQESGQINAYADGKQVVVTKGMTRFVENDDELALVIGHEYGHNAMRHIEAKQTTRPAE